MITSDQLKDVLERTEKLHHYLNIDQKKVEFEEEQLRTQAPDFWDDPKRAEAQMKKVKGIEKWLNGYKQCKQNADELQLAFDYYKEELVTEEEVRLCQGCQVHRGPRAEKHAAPRRGLHGRGTENQFWRWWH